MAAERQEQCRRDRYGFFSDDGTEYVLYNPQTPRSWQHLISNDDYLLQISQWAVGYSVYRSIFANTVTRMSWPKDDTAGRFFYFREADTGKVWSPTIWPVHNDPAELDEYKCRYGLGYMCWETLRNELGSRLTASVALNDCLEIYSLELTNHSSRFRTMDVFFCLEWLFGGAPAELGSALESYFDSELNCQIGNLKLPGEYRYRQTGFLTCDKPIVSYDCWRSAFMGDPANIALPKAVLQGQCGNHPGPIMMNDGFGTIHTRLELPAGSKAVVNFLVGIVDQAEQIKALCDRYLASEAATGELKAIKDFWAKKLSGLKVSGNDDRMDLFANTWLKYQVYQNARWTRWAGHKGYRDVLQDSAGTRLIDSDRAGKMVTTAASKQLASGHAPRQWKTTPWGDHDWRDYRDSCFWLVYGLEKQLKETGRTELLAEQIPFIDDKTPVSLFEHAHRAVKFLWCNRGQHGLCLIGQGDWLDSLNAAGIKGRGESVWLTQAACYALREMEQIAQLAGKPENTDIYRKWRSELTKAINTAGWDGQWYLMAYNDFGEPIGSADCSDGGKIFLNPQSWAVLSGVADPQRAAAVMNTAEEMLQCPWGYLCYTPMYSRYDPHIGRICLWPSDGASVYCHAVTFKIVADCIMGDGDRAWQSLSMITPAAKEHDLDKSAAEPFCYSNALTGPDWPIPGRSFTGWSTGTATWALQVIAEWIFGARADYQGLRIDPCLPKDWTKAHISRSFRGCIYDIDITKPNSISKGPIRLTVDGTSIQGNLITPLPDGQTHKVQCEIC